MSNQKRIISDIRVTGSLDITRDDWTERIFTKYVRIQLICDCLLCLCTSYGPGDINQYESGSDYY